MNRPALRFENANRVHLLDNNEESLEKIASAITSYLAYQETENNIGFTVKERPLLIPDNGKNSTIAVIERKQSIGTDGEGNDVYLSMFFEPKIKASEDGRLYLDYSTIYKSSMSQEVFTTLDQLSDDLNIVLLSNPNIGFDPSFVMTTIENTAEYFSMIIEESFTQSVDRIKNEKNNAMPRR